MICAPIGSFTDVLTVRRGGEDNWLQCLELANIRRADWLSSMSGKWLEPEFSVGYYHFPSNSGRDQGRTRTARFLYPHQTFWPVLDVASETGPHGRCSLDRLIDLGSGQLERARSYGQAGDAGVRARVLRD